MPVAQQGWVWHDEPRKLGIFEFYDGTGVRVSNFDYRGKPVLLNIWATWCLPCIVELPQLDRLAADPANAGLTILPIAREETSLARLQHMYKGLLIDHLPIALDPNYSLIRPFGETPLPTTILLNPQGREIGRIEGLLDWESEDGKAIIQRAIAEGERDE